MPHFRRRCCCCFLNGKNVYNFRFGIFLAITQEPQDIRNFWSNIWIPWLILHKIGIFLWKIFSSFLVTQINWKNMAPPVSPVLKSPQFSSEELIKFTLTMVPLHISFLTEFSMSIDQYFLYLALCWWRFSYICARYLTLAIDVWLYTVKALLCKTGIQNDFCITLYKRCRIGIYDFSLLTKYCN